MKPAELKATLMASIEASEHVYTEHLSPTTAREQYVSEGRRHLLDSLIEPISVKVGQRSVGEQTFGTAYEGYALAHHQASWLIYSPERKLFNIAWSSPDGTLAERVASLEDKDWWSGDALAIWLL